jgi:hypothetical protein
MNDLKKLFIIILRSLRPWRLRERYSEFPLWLCRTIFTPDKVLTA